MGQWSDGKKKPLIPLQQHSISRLQIPWKCAQLGLLIFPIIPSLGALGIFIALIGTWRQKYRQIIHRPLNWGLAILAIWLVITATFGFHRSDAVLGLFNFLPFFGLFAAFSVLIQTPAQLRQLARILVFTSIPVVIIGLGQLFLDWVTLAQLQSIIGWTIAPDGNPPGRMASVFMYANILAGYLVISFILALELWIEAYKKVRSKRQGTRRIQPLATLCFMSAAVIGNLVALILTNSRNAWAIAIFACLAFAVYQGWRWLIAGVAAIAGSILLAAFGPSPIQLWLRQIVPAFFWARLTDQMYPDRPVALLRTTQWQSAWTWTLQRPWTGWGLRNFTPLYQEHMNVWLGHPHNFLLMLTVETGIPAAIFFCGWTFWIIIQGIQLLRNWPFIAELERQQRAQDKLIFFSFLVAFFACVLFNTVDVSLFDLRLNTLGWLLLSAICGVVYKGRTNVYSQF